MFYTKGRGVGQDGFEGVVAKGLCEYYAVYINMDRLRRMDNE
jgi:hypothetical protein